MEVLPTLLAILSVFHLARGHGYLKDPLNRASLWREAVPGAPIDYNDNQLFCGGFQRQWAVNRGRCGICGDDYSLSRPRPYENTGNNTIGYVVKAYSSGDAIRVTAMVTASHLGYFEFHLCPLSGPGALEEEDCFAPLPLADGSGFEYRVKTWHTGEYTTMVVLPKGVTCERCVLRWQYTAGNSWGVCSGGSGALGCGPQETFRSCADVSILPRAEPRPKGEFIKALFSRPQNAEPPRPIKSLQQQQRKGKERAVRAGET